MRLLLVNWAPLWRGAEAGGGVNVHVRALAHELARRGHRVSAVNAGYSYDLTGFPRLRRPVRDGAVDCHEIVNSPVIAPGYFNLARPDLDVRAPGVEARFAKLLRRLRPEVVHFHNIEGFSGHCITLARESGARVVYSLHNYHPLCSQINLLYQNRTPCTDYRNGQRCLDCQPPPPPRWRQRLRRRALFYLRGLPGAGRWRGRIRRLAVQGPAARGAPASLHADDFRHRREQLVACLNRADLLLAVSNWVREVYVRQGVDPARVRVNTIGSPSADWPRLPDPPRAAGTPLRLVFLGMAEPHKGLPLLLDALAGMTDAELAAIDLALYARGVPALSERLGALRPRLAGLNPQDGYRHDDLPRLLAGRDLGVVPPIWWDNAPQVVFELLALGVPVLGTRIGGIPDFVSDGVNGLLVEPHDPAALAAGIRRVLADPALTSRLRQGIRPMKSLRTHADELETFYTPGRG